MKTLRYYCEHCGAEVRRDAKLCPRCGRFFSSVKCPKCEYTGAVSEFDSGCPVCGFQEAPTAAPEPFAPPPVAAPPLSPWVYAVVGLALVAALLLLLNTIR